MKKIALILICCLVLIGCKNKDNNDNKFYRQYKEYENKIDNHKEERYIKLYGNAT